MTPLSESASASHPAPTPPPESVDHGGAASRGSASIAKVAEKETAEKKLADFRRIRNWRLTNPKGPLALVSTNWIAGDLEMSQAIHGVAGAWYPLGPNQAGLRLIASAGDGITVNGQLVDGEALLYPADDTEPSEIRFSDTVQGTIIHSEADGSYGLRVWDADSENVREFGSISVYPYNPDWTISAQFMPQEGVAVGFQHMQEEAPRDVVIPGFISFDKDGVSYRLVAFPAGKSLQLVFADTTNGKETYSMGRFLFVTPEEDDDTVLLDFNRAILPPCAFSHAFNCPMPPTENRFPVPIEAGEKQVLSRSGAPLHQIRLPDLDSNQEPAG